MFRRVTHSREFSHIHKKCACGKQTTAKQLTQYGRCITCEKTAKQSKPVFHLTTGHAEFLHPDNGNRRFVVFPANWTKARKA